ncbi:MAG: lamin tail domain-containing protein [Flavobacteriia bacterium]
MLKKLLLPTLFLLTFFSNAQVVINEASNANGSTIVNPDGSTSDWIEIYNSSTQAINLQGYGLSDKKSEPLKWIFPSAILSSNGFVTLLASGFIPSQSQQINHYETAVYPNFSWKYIIPDAVTPINWMNPSFDASSWTNANLGIGYGDGDDLTDLGSGITSVFTRIDFTLADTSKIVNAILDLDFDDGFVAYLNGIEIARSGLAGYPPIWDELSSDHEAQIYQGGNPMRYNIDPITLKSAMLNGNNVLAIEVHNTSTTSSDLSLIPFLTFGFEDAAIYFDGTLHQWFDVQVGSLFQTNFTIKTEGEAIYLSNPNGIIIDSMFVPDLEANTSFGKFNDGTNNLVYFETPTPNASNNASLAYSAYEKEPTILFSGGFYINQITIDVNNNSVNGGVLRYTLSGQTPDINSPIFSGPLNLSVNAAFKVRCFPTVPNVLPSVTATETYVFMEDFSIPVLSITTDDVNLYGAEGIFDNYNTDWKKPCFVEYFDKDGIKILDTKASIKPDGGAGGSRSNPQHSVTIEPSNSVFGEGKPIKYPLIPAKSHINEYYSFYLRNGSNLWNQYPQKDATIMRIMAESNAGSQAYSPVVVYLNGEYFGVYELREKTKEEYFQSNYGNDPDSLDLLSVSYFYGAGILRVSEGSDTGFYNMRDFVTTYNPLAPDYFNKSHEKIDLYNFADYIAAENWFGNYDWIYNNMKVFRTRTAGNRWRFNLQDMEIGLGIWSDYNSDLFDYFRTQNLPNPYSEIYTGLMQNTQFHDYFINRYADLMNTTFQEDYYKPIIKEMYDELLPEMPRQFERWTGDVTGGMQTYAANLDVLMYQYALRNASVRNQMINEFSLEQQVSVTLNVQPEGAGYIKISTIVPRTLPWTGVYFDGVPVEITAVPNPGYSFVSWQANTEIPAGELGNMGIKLNIDQDETFVALFEGNSSELNLTISEINYNSDPSINGGNWIELHNYSNSDLHLGDWKIKSKNFYDKFTLPIDTKIPANGYLVVCEDTNLFKQVYPNVLNFVGSTEFGWSNSLDSIRIYDPYATLRLFAVYSDSLPYPECADGWGRTLELKESNSNLTLGDSWFCGCIAGSPGTAFVPCSEDIIFTEINYNSVISPYNSGDWVEIKNNSNQTINLGNYVFKDAKDDHIFSLPNYDLAPEDYLVIGNDEFNFHKQHEDVTNFVGNFDFGLSDNLEVVRLFDSAGKIVNSVLYKSSSPWTSIPKNGNYTLEYKDTIQYFDPSAGSSWFASCVEGSPGRAFTPCLYLGENENLGLYPNPTDGQIWIVFDNDDSDYKDFTIRIVDLEGRIVYQEEIQSDEKIYGKQLNVDFAANGMYFVTIEKGSKIIQKAFVKI